MIRLIAILVMAASLSACSSAMTSAPTRGPGLNGPANAPPNECYTDEGYGRWHPCGNMS